MLGTEDTVIGEEGNAAGRAYFETHSGPRWETQPRPASSRTAPPRTAPHRTAPHRTAPHRTAPHRTAPHRTAPHRTAPHPCWRRPMAPSHTLGRQLLEIRRGGHVSFTSCELYNPEYGNGIGESNSLSRRGEKYTPMPIVEQHAVINAYGLAFLNAHLRPAAQGPELAGFNAAYLQANHFDADEVVWK